MKIDIDRAVEIIKEEIPFTSGIIEEALSVIELCAYKQIPKKGIMIGDEYSSVLSCPNCRKPILKQIPFVEDVDEEIKQLEKEEDEYNYGGGINEQQPILEEQN